MTFRALALSASTLFLWSCSHADELSTKVQELTAVEAAFYAAFLEADGEAFLEIFADDFTYQHGSGFDFTEETFVDLMTSGAVVVTRADAPDLKFKDYGDTVITFGASTVEGVSGEDKFGGTLRFVNVWTRSDENWQLNHRNSQFLPE